MNSIREITIRASGAALGNTVGGPVGAALGTVVADILNRHLSEMEQKRVEIVASLAGQEISDRVKAGESLRHGWADGSATYHEVAENVLLKAQREPEEKKLPYMAHLLANIAFDSVSPNYKVNVSMSQQLIKVAEELSYRQLCILGLFGRIRGIPTLYNSLRKEDYFSKKLMLRSLKQLQFIEGVLDGLQIYACSEREVIHSMFHAQPFQATGRVD